MRIQAQNIRTNSFFWNVRNALANKDFCIYLFMRQYTHSRSWRTTQLRHNDDVAQRTVYMAIDDHENALRTEHRLALAKKIIFNLV